MRFDDVISDGVALCNHYIIRDGYIFSSLDEPTNVYDAIVIRYPENATSAMNVYSNRSFAETIDYVKFHKIEKAIIIADDISFLKNCTSLRYLDITPSFEAEDGFDYSPLYHLENLIYLCCQTEYGYKGTKRTSIDYAKIQRLQKVNILGSGHINLLDNITLEEIVINGLHLKDLSNAKRNSNLKKLTICQCGVETLSGIENFPNLEELNLWHLKKLQDIDNMQFLSDRLKRLEIDHCGGIKSFLILEKMQELQYLVLEGRNKVENINFITSLINLGYFQFGLNCIDGDMSRCMSIPYVCISNKKHYNMRNSQMPKDMLAFRNYTRVGSQI